mmetsp:Transcript_18134/g.27047  ORF Transcript_18134/g.27047 Transcript_18134/m.27047 type:complete len:91 (+) Transcript_18134:49-321(+)
MTSNLVSQPQSKQPRLFGLLLINNLLSNQRQHTKYGIIRHFLQLLLVTILLRLNRLMYCQNNIFHRSPPKQVQRVPTIPTTQRDMNRDWN